MNILKSMIALLVFSTIMSVKAIAEKTLISVDENNPVKVADSRLLGFNYSWAGQFDVCGIPFKAGYDPQVVKKLRGLALPLNRLSGTSANIIKWKEAIGPYSKRAKQKLVNWWKEEGRKIGLGPIEWIKMVLAIDPDAHFTWTVNLFESPEDTADLVEFFTGDGKSNPNGGINWAQKRIEYGIARPIKVDVWELGNELDGPEWRNKFKSIYTYTNLCRKHISAIRSVSPKAKIAAHAATFSSLVVYAKFFGDSWEIWHRTVLKEIGAKIDYLAFHPYYNSLPSSRLEHDLNVIAKDIYAISGSNRIKLYISEYGWWPKTAECPPGSPQWKNCWYTTHALIGCLATADWLTRMMNSSAVRFAAYHAFSGGPWGLIYRDRKGGKLYTTGIVSLYKLFDAAYQDAVDIVSVSVSGPDTDRSSPKCMFSVAALTTASGINLVLVNQDPKSARQLSFRFLGRYTLVEANTLTAASMDSYNTLQNRPIKTITKHFNSKNALTKYTVPAKSLLILRLKRL